MSEWKAQDVIRVNRILDGIQFNDWKFCLAGADLSSIYLQIAVKEKCNKTGEPHEWKSRKWLLSPFMTDGEIVQTAFLAVLTALEHEAREQFKYMGVSVFDPHYDIAKLVELRRAVDAILERPKP